MMHWSYSLLILYIVLSQRAFLTVFNDSSQLPTSRAGLPNTPPQRPLVCWISSARGTAYAAPEKRQRRALVLPSTLQILYST